jgi:cell division protein FtsQ
MTDHSLVPMAARAAGIRLRRTGGPGACARHPGMSDVAQTAPADGRFRPALLAGAAALLAAAVVWGAPRLRLFPLHEVQVTHELRDVRRSELEERFRNCCAATSSPSIIEALRQSLEGLPWVRRAEMWRKWPSRIEVRIEEHQAVAHWGDGQGHWSIPTARCFRPRSCDEQSLPRLSGPTGSSGEVLRRYEEFAQLS